MRIKTYNFRKNRVPNRMHPKRPTQRHTVFKMAKVKDKLRILKATRKKVLTYKEAPIRLSADFSAETFQDRRNWHDIFKVMKNKDLNQDYFTQQSYHLKLKEELRTRQTIQS